MASSLREFGKIAQRLARNPIGIIGLFIVLVYASASIVLSVSDLNEAERFGAVLIRTAPDPLDAFLRELGIAMIAPHRRNRKKPPTQDGRALRRSKRRWKVERLFAW